MPSSSSSVAATSSREGSWDGRVDGFARRTMRPGAVRRELVRELRDELNAGGYPPLPTPSGGSAPWTIRGVESVWFMDGY